MSVKQLLDLTGRIALVTGGSRGLGLQIAEGLGEMGAKVALSARKRDELDAARTHLDTLGIEALTIVADLSQPDAAEPLVQQVLARYGKIDILVNNAGTTWGAPAEDHPLDAWRKVLDLNLTAAFLVAQQAAKLTMISRRYGRIINIASIAGLKGLMPNVLRTAAYNASKGGLVNLTRALAAEWGQYNLTVNAICPGFFPSKMTRGSLERLGETAVANVPLGRIGGPEDLKGTAILLASDASQHMTGQIIAIDGGASIV